MAADALRVARQQPDVNRAFGAVLRDFRKRRGLTQEALAAACELHVTYISQLERGLKSPSLTTLVLVGEALEVSAGELVIATEKKARPARSDTRSRRPGTNAS